MIIKAEGSSEEQKTVFGLILGVLGAIGGVFGWKKQKAATEQARIAADAEILRLAAEEKKHQEDATLEARRQGIREHEDQLRRTEYLETLVDSLQKRLLRQGDERLALERALDKAVKVNPFPECVKCTDAFRASMSYPRCDGCTDRAQTMRGIIGAVDLIAKETADHDSDDGGENDDPGK